MSYSPPFQINNKIIEQVARIAELTGKISASANLERNSTLRRKNRILTIQGSLAIEQNSLTLEQITDVINGKTVLAPPKDIKEVKIEEEKITITDLLLKVGFAQSKGAAKRMIAGRGVKLNGETIEDITLTIKIAEPFVLQFGKNKFAKVIN